MAAFNATLLLVSILAANGAALVAEQSTLMRRDAPRNSETALHLGATGAMIQVNADASSQPKESTAQASGALDECRAVFLHGTEDTDDCGDYFHLNDVECDDAATLLGITKSTQFKLVGEWNENRHPRGCFKAACEESDAGCMFYNERESNLEDTDDPVQGTAGDQVCPAGSRAIPDAAGCEYAAGKLGAGFKYMGEATDWTHVTLEGCVIDTQTTKQVWFTTKPADDTAAHTPKDTSNRFYKPVCAKACGYDETTCREAAGQNGYTEGGGAKQAESGQESAGAAAGTYLFDGDSEELPGNIAGCYSAVDGDVTRAYYGKIPTGDTFKGPESEHQLANATAPYARVPGTFNCKPSRYQNSVKGVPMCKKEKYMRSTFMDGDKNVNVSCPKGYSPLPDAPSCITAAPCSGEALGEPLFATTLAVDLNAKDKTTQRDKNTEYTALDAANHFPHSCFIHEVNPDGIQSGRVFWNPDKDSAGTALPAPTAPKGTLLCRAEEIGTTADLTAAATGAAAATATGAAATDAVATGAATTAATP